MRVNSSRSGMLVALAAVAGLTGCGPSEPGPAPDPTATAMAMGDADLTSPVAAQTAAPPPQSCEPTSYCSGPLVVRADNLALTRPDDRRIQVVGTLSFENRSTSDLRVALLSGEMVLNTDKGITAKQGNIYTSGLGVCQRDGSSCYDGDPDTFRLVAPGDSPAKVNVSLGEYIAAAQNPLVAQIETGTLTLEAYTVAADGARQVHRIALSNVPITNQVAQ